jgi:hypothetical protein
VAARPRKLLGLIPLAFLAWALYDFAVTDTLPDSLWMCNVANAILGVGLLVGSVRMLWIATLALIVGSPLWFWDAILGVHVHPHSFFTHVVSAGFGVWLLRGQPRVPRAWLATLGVGVALQVICHFATPPSYNVNVSHAPFHALASIVPSFALYSVLNTIFMGVVLFCLERVLCRHVSTPVCR